MTGPGRLHQLSSELRELCAALMLGGGEDRIRRQHDQGKWTARERIGRLLDSDIEWVEVGMLVAHDQYEGQAPGAGVVTGVGVVAGREVVIVANDATVKAFEGSWMDRRTERAHGSLASAANVIRHA